MVRKTQHQARTRWIVLLVDDDQEYAESTSALLQREGHTVLLAHSGERALEVLAETHVDLLLLDYFMHGMTGEDVVQQLRTTNPLVQVILQTGYATEQPPRHLLKRLDIQGYHDKSEGPDKLLMWVDVGLKAAYASQLVHKSREGLRYILNVTPKLHKLQPLDELLQGIICQVTGLLGVTDSFVASRARSGRNAELAGFLAMRHDDTELVVHAGTGRFAGVSSLSEQHGDAALIGDIASAISAHGVQVNAHSTAVPLRVGSVSIGVIYLDQPVHAEQDLELLSVFANQAAVAIQNAQLFEMATIDPLTGVYLRRFVEEWMLRELRKAFRTRQSVCLLMLDMDGLKRINDTAGHLYGDEALASMGQVLRGALRESDIAGRFGGDEFMLALPDTSADGGARVASRIIAQLAQTSVHSAGTDFPVRTSIGMTVLPPHTFTDAELMHPIGKDYFQGVLKHLFEEADAALYEAKRNGRGQTRSGAVLDWPRLTP